MSRYEILTSAEDHQAFMRMLKKAKINQCSAFLHISPEGGVGFFNESADDFGEDTKRLNRFENDAKELLKDIVSKEMNSVGLSIPMNGIKAYLTLKKKNKLAEIILTEA